MLFIIQVADLQNEHFERHKKFLINTGYLIVYYNKYHKMHNYLFQRKEYRPWDVVDVCRLPSQHHWQLNINAKNCMAPGGIRSSARTHLTLVGRH